MLLNDFIYAWKTSSTCNDTQGEGRVIAELNSKANAIGHDILLDATSQLSCRRTAFKASHEQRDCTAFVRAGVEEQTE